MYCFYLPPSIYDGSFPLYRDMRTEPMSNAISVHFLPSFCSSVCPLLLPISVEWMIDRRAGILITQQIRAHIFHRILWLIRSRSDFYSLAFFRMLLHFFCLLPKIACFTIFFSNIQRPSDKLLCFSGKLSIQNLRTSATP